MAKQAGIGNRIAPARFLAFAAVGAAAVPAGIGLWGWAVGAMAGFDAAAALFLLLILPLLRRSTTAAMRAAARANDANRAGLLAISAAVAIAVLAAVATALSAQRPAPAAIVALVIVTLALAWTFTNIVFALHYAHLFYLGDSEGKDRAGLAFPACREPAYWDFVYFAFTLGMTFQTSDVAIETREVRKVAIFHCLVAFVFNLGILAFTINVLGGR